MPCGDNLLAKQKSRKLSGFQGFFEEYVPVFLAGKASIWLSTPDMWAANW